MCIIAGGSISKLQCITESFRHEYFNSRIAVSRIRFVECMRWRLASYVLMISVTFSSTSIITEKSLYILHNKSHN